MPGLVARLGPWVAVVAAAAWASAPSPWWLVLVAAGAASAAMGGREARAPRPAARGGALLLLLSVVALGFVAHHRLQDLRQDWDGYWEDRESVVFQHLDDVLGDLVDRGDRAAEALAQLAERHDGRPPHAQVAALRAEAGFPAVAVYGPQGELLVWDGTHRGRVPEHVQRGMDAYAYEELPLFSYMYFTYPVRSVGGTAVVATLVRTDLPEGLRARTGDLALRLRNLTGERVRISRSERLGRVSFDYWWPSPQGPDTLFSVTVEEPTSRERWDRVRLGWTRRIVALTFLAWLLLAFAWRGEPQRRIPAAASLLALALLVPFGALLGVEPIFGAAMFLLPGPLPVTLGRILAVGSALAVGLSLMLRGPRGSPVAAAGLAVTAGFPLVLWLFLEGASATALGGVESDWVVFQLAASVVLTLVAAPLLATAGRREDPERRGVRGLVLGLGATAVVALLLTAAVATRARAEPSPPLWLAAAWALPALTAAWTLARARPLRQAFLGWAVAGVLGTTAALPFAWGGRIEARMTLAAVQMDRLGAEADPYLAFLLERLAGTLDSLDARGAGAPELLYRGWVDSGLAEEGYPVSLTLWSPGGFPEERFPAQNDPAPGVTTLDVEATRVADTVVIRRLDLPNAQYLMTVPLQGGWVVTGVVSHLKDVRESSPLGPLLGGFHDGRQDPLRLVPLHRTGEDATELPPAPGPSADSLQWALRDEGWLGEMSVVYPEERYHAHYLVDLPGPLVLAARGTLLLVLNLTLLLALWVVGRVTLLDARPLGPGWKPLLTSFRARVTLALFAFFVLSNAIFGTLAYRTIAGAAERAAAVLAERVVEDAASVYLPSGGGMEPLGRQVGADLLEYRDGELRSGSAEELVELGLYEGWLPYRVDVALSMGEAVLSTDEQALGRWEYVRAFRLLPDGDILAAPVPLQAGATAVRRREVADLLGFALVGGAFLSLLLALLVGRTLTRPIHTLQVASERVGSGNLEVRLPVDRTDEFGEVFTAFNRMVRRLRRARRDLVRTTRRTQAIVEDAATGVMALSPSGRLALVNRRAVELLRRDVEVGERLRERGDAADEIVRWIRLYFRDGLREAATEFQLADRRVRVRARRISREGSLGGAVLSLEDVTDELRTERILAWGEMARQVAHEVKNPLTPIKLSIQHIRRAFEDRRTDFDAILDRNAEAALREIDRLAAIASSFSRFGAPEEAGLTPLQPVRLASVVDEVLALYASGEGGVRFDADVSPALPAAQARPSELKEVLVNLLENSRAAIRDEGRVRLEAGVEDGGQTVVLRVRDDGSGIPPALLPRIFEPHFSTRSTGTGLGLAIVKRLVESWDAVVVVDSEPGRGTVVCLRLRPWGGAEADPRGGVAPGYPSDSTPAVPTDGDEP